MPVAPYKSTVLLWSECDGDLVDLLCDEAVVVEDDAVRGLGSLLHQTNNIETIYLPVSIPSLYLSLSVCLSVCLSLSLFLSLSLSLSLFCKIKLL